MALRVESAARTDTGRVRRSNQDSHGTDTAMHLYVVCDGMGGAAGGEIASQLATETFLRAAAEELSRANFQDPELNLHALDRATTAANRAVHDKSVAEPRLHGMGCTLVGARLDGQSLTVVNVGDSRAYLLRDGRITQITEDHSYVAEQVRLGRMSAAEAEKSAYQSVITRAVGAAPEISSDLYEETMVPGDTLLLVSDGVVRHLNDAQLAEFGAETDLEAAAETLIREANERGGSDNSTCVLVRLSEVEDAA